jgi:ribosome-associated translation inhibitor RaiA
MRLLVDAKNLTRPTEDTIYLYAIKKLKKVRRLLRKTNIDNLAEVKFSVEFHKSNKSFSMKAVMTIGSKTFVVQMSDHDLRRAINNIVENLQMQLVESRGKDWLNYHH